MAIYREKDIFERRNAANEAKKALLARFNSRPAEDDPAVLARKVLLSLLHPSSTVLPCPTVMYVEKQT